MPSPQQFQPDWVSAPGDTIIDILQERRLSKKQFAEKMGQPIDAVDDLLAGRLAITIGLARRLEAVLGGSVKFWMTRDFHYRSDATKHKEGNEFQWLSELPLADMIRLG